jgi:hypothetical protein
LGPEHRVDFFSDIFAFILFSKKSFVFFTHLNGKKWELQLHDTPKWMRPQLMVFPNHGMAYGVSTKWTHPHINGILCFDEIEEAV